MCEKADDASLPAWKFGLAWFLRPKMLEDRDNDAFFYNDTDLNDDPNKVTLINDNFNVTFFNHCKKMKFPIKDSFSKCDQIRMQLICYKPC